MQIAEFFASLKIKPDQASIARADRWLKTFEKRIQRSARRVEKSDVLGTMLGLNEKKVARQAQRTLDVVSKSAVFRINNFKINTKRLQQTLDAVIRNNNTPLSINNFRINRASLRRSLEVAAGSFAIPIRIKGGGIPSSPKVNPSHQPSSPRSHSRFSLSPRGVGFAAGGIGVFGGFGIAALNRTVTGLETLPVALESVTGSRQAAESQLAYLNALGNEIGAPVMNLAPSYTKFLASAQGTKLEPFAQSGFRSLSRYGAVMGLDAEAMKGTFRAVEQMTNKQAIMAEELKGQLAERLPAAVRIMADVAAGGDTKKLFKMMEEGQLDPNVHLPLFFEALEAKAAGGWDAYTNTVRYQQNQSSKRFEDFIKIFSTSGGNDGFFLMWKTFADTLPRLDSIAKALGSTFRFLGEMVRGLGDVMILINDGLAWFRDQSPEIQTAIFAMAGAWAVLRTSIGRTLAPLLGIYLILEDIAAYNQGKKSITGLALGEDYGPQPPALLNGKDFYKGRAFGETISKLENKMLINQGSSFDSVKLAALKSYSALWNPVISAAESAHQFFSPNYDTIKLTSEASMAAMSTSISGIDKIPGFSPSGLTIENITINANTNDPEEHANQFIKRVELDVSAVNFPKGEGEG